MDLRAKIATQYQEDRLQSQRIGEVDFSGSTYQIQVIDQEGDEFWPFLQFDESGRLADCLCSCEAVGGDGCIHLAAALRHISDPPLHQRFYASLWNRVCEVFADRQGVEPSVLTKLEPGHYVLDAVTGKRLFDLEGDPVRLEAMIERRVVETEENSLKFFGLSHEELARWREGRPSDQLRYELSFWSDLAKWLFFEQQGPYEIEFDLAPSGLPNGLHARFSHIELWFYISEANLPLAIPYLRTVDSPLHVHHFEEEALDRIVYNPVDATFSIFAKEGIHQAKEPDLEGAIDLGAWFFLPGDGFYSQEEHSLLATPKVESKDVAHFLTQHSETVGRHLESARVHLGERSLSYEVFFDSEWNLHLKSYLLLPGDLVEGESRAFGSWVYLDGDGFYEIRDRLFDGVERIVPEQEVSTFIHHHRNWLSSIPGFHTYITTVESKFTYAVDDEGLHFQSELDFEEKGAKSFGDWIYLPGQGFFSKRLRGRGAPIADGVTVLPSEIGLFIRTHREELSLIDSFFSDECPVVAASLCVRVQGDDHLLVEPEYRLLDENKKVRFFDEWVFDDGFSELPGEVRLPPRFRQPVHLKGKELELFLQYELDSLKPQISSLDPRLEESGDLSLVVEEADLGRSGLIDLKLRYKGDRGAISASKVWGALREGSRFLFSKSGLIDLGDERFHWLRQVPAARVSKDLQLTAVEFIRLTALERLECTHERVHSFLESFISLSPPNEPVIDGLASELRHYQQIGVRWLWFLYHHGLSGLLCDDMGLGKTHQSMALMAAISNQAQERPLYLVVCPTSVIYHWQEKLERFLPHLRILVHYGPGRSLDILSESDLLLTSYGILRSDRKLLSKIPFELAIYDEIQVAKNHSSQTYRALEGIQARMRLGLTGTPIENSLRELKALFDLVLPGYLPDEGRFREQFSIPIEKAKDAVQRALLRRIIHPFVLRRKKEEVLLELPEKVEEKMHCELVDEQKRLYEEVLRPQRKRLIHDLESGEEVPYVHIFALLGSLKQVCDHPALYLKEPQNYHHHQSGKWRLFVDLLSQARESGQKVVVFSHYLGMLDIIESYLKESSIGYAAVRGGTARRGEELRRFAEDPTCEVFVGSLQAVGLGVDLTAASVVIHYDRWWNAAREQQATDRVYRIGQTRGVQVFKLLTLGTLEEGIDQMIDRKGELMEEVVRSDDQSQLKSFSREELIQLLSFPSLPENETESDSQ